MDESTKIQYLKRNIKPEADLENARTISRTNTGITADFQKFANFIAAEVDHKNLRRGQITDARKRNVSKFFKGNNQGRGHGKGRSGQGGQKGGNDRGNYQRNSQRNNQYPGSSGGGPILSARVNDKVVEARSYQKEDYAKLDPDQRNKVAELNRKRKALQGSTNNGHNPTVVLLAKFTDAMTDIGDTIVADVFKASKEPGDLDDITVNTRRSLADSGSVGEYIAAVKKRRANRRRSTL